jgi:hypothetical protein
MMRPTDQDRATFAALADRLIPAWGKMPAASAVKVQGELLDLVLRVRPDLEEGVARALKACAGRDASQAINALHGSDAEAFGALSLAVTGAYYMADEVWQKLGYPGQDGATYDPHATPDYLTDGTLERVVRRGPLYKPTPR